MKQQLAAGLVLHSRFVKSGIRNCNLQSYTLNHNHTVSVTTAWAFCAQQLPGHHHAWLSQPLTSCHDHAKQRLWTWPLTTCSSSSTSWCTTTLQHMHCCQCPPVGKASDALIAGRAACLVLGDITETDMCVSYTLSHLTIAD